ncbi:cinnamoyl-CoA reductase 1-like [Triticum urartu]|uniref:NAD-dependent epimerase/dehydratase domain-containing protein n=1 Tax=Triticum urartu TaxID=4572 RepID=A0A8R7VEK9_TRIUA|nr:cinnamoyl-CoA reductase 1-like [Triticum urartu]XP_048543787.1 cinnamoyl-CoA reductase 1-like [Triticum urartu]
MEGEASKTKTVCVTGAGGFVGSWLVRRLLSTGEYTVHGTVRDLGDRRTGHLKALDGAGERLRLFKADVLDYAGVAYAVSGCGGVFHVASPVPADKPQNPEVEVLAPAVRGTQNVLKACHQAKVGRVVVVSSAAAVAMNPGFPRDAVLDEDAWSDEDHCRTTGMWYALSKTLAEREALAYAEKTGLDVVTVCPPLVLGPLLQRVANTSSLVLVNLLKGDRDTVEDKARNAVDVRDLADALVLAYETPEASGRYICGAYRKKLSEMVDIVKSFYPDLTRPMKFVEGEEERMMSSKKLQALGWKLRAVEECLRDSVESYKAAGLLPE